MQISRSPSLSPRPSKPQLRAPRSWPRAMMSSLRAPASTALQALSRLPSGLSARPKPVKAILKRVLRLPRHASKPFTRPLPQYHNAMEPHAIVATWEGDRLSIDTPSQGLVMAQARIARLFGISPDHVHIRSPFLGGGFGSKGILGPQILAILVARLVGKPVKLVLQRNQMYGPVGHRPPTRQRLRLGMDEHGRLTALAHHVKTVTSTFDDFVEPLRKFRTALCEPGNRSDPRSLSHRHRHATLHAGSRGGIRIDRLSAIDEAAEACRIDPLAFRLKNYAEIEPISGKPFSSKALRECYEQGADRFGWSGRPLRHGGCAMTPAFSSAGAWVRRLFQL